MKLPGISALVFLISGCTVMQASSPAVSILTDLDPASVEPTVIVESIAADRNGVLYLPDRVTGNILRVDPKSPVLVVVARIASRTVDSKKVDAFAGGILLDAKGDLYVAAGPLG